MRGGRPSSYSQKTADIICTRLIEGESLRKICSDKDMPHIATVMRWLPKHDDFREQYARAKEEQADTIFDECLAIADQYSPEADKENPDHIARAKLRIDTRKWMAGKLRPKVYGDKMVVGGDSSLDPIKTEETGNGAAKLAAALDAIASRTSSSTDA